MPHHKRNNYLRTYRRRCGMSQREIAWLLGRRDAMVSSRYERGERQPGIAALFAFEIMLRAPSRQLFAGVFHTVEREVRMRARLLMKKVEKQEHSRLRQRKLDVLREIVGTKGQEIADAA